MARKPKHIAEFGDFQTPDELAGVVMRYLKGLGIKPSAIVEPSCGKGAFLVAASKSFPSSHLFGLEINDAYLTVARQRMNRVHGLTLERGSFFTHDWGSTLKKLPKPLLVVGNPPWVTNSELGSLGSGNLPQKANFHNFKGLDALTGKSNFDISEWMLIQNLDWIIKEKGVLAMLCKIAVARKVLTRAWRLGIPISDARIVRIDAMGHFGAAVEACLCIVRADMKATSQSCHVFSSFEEAEPASALGFLDDTILADVDEYEKNRWLRGVDRQFTWRSGLKHDCSKVMELNREKDGTWSNGFGEVVDIEPSYVFPLVKSSDIGGARKREKEKGVIVPQRAVGEATETIKTIAPKTWNYLMRHSNALDRRTSVIYRKKPRFSVFGVGPYTFAPWKIAISGMYKKLEFKLYGPLDGRPIIFDDTVYFLPFDRREDAVAALNALQGSAATNFLTSMVFWDEKRPITVELLKRLNLSVLLASVCGRRKQGGEQLTLFAPEVPNARSVRQRTGRKRAA